MTTIHLQRTGLPELTFEGHLVTQQAGCDQNGLTQGRYHNISIYEADDRELLVCIEFHSPFASELSDSFVEAVDSIEGVDAILSLHEPGERLDRTLFEDRNSNRRQTVEANLTARFDKQVTDALTVLVAEHV